VCRIKNLTTHFSVLLFGSAILCNVPILAQTLAQNEASRQNARPAKVKPTLGNVSYGPSDAQSFDFWRADTEEPSPLYIYIHGGGFRGGDKSSMSQEQLTSCLKAGIAVVSLNYRLSGEALYPAQTDDCARAIQCIRSKAKEWNIDSTRFAAGGGSAGSGLSQWLGYHDDLADPKSEDPIARESTRLSAVIPFNMQSTYYPLDIKKIVPGKAYDHPALKQLFGLPLEWDWNESKIDEKLEAGLRDVSPVTHLTKDDPPVFILQYVRNDTDGNIHHGNFARHLKKELDKLAIESELHYDTDFKSNSAHVQAITAFIIKHFDMK